MGRLYKIVRRIAPDLLARYESTEWELRRRLKSAGAKTRPKPPGRAWLNSTLLSMQQVDRALEEVRFCGLPPHKDPPKNWDALSALQLILERTTPNSRILEVGATLYSITLPWLYLYGYRNLRGIDLIFDRPVRRGPILYEHGDMAHTHFGDASFDVIVCLSVIEHGVEIPAFFCEMARLLNPGGVLIVSTDYWVDPVDTHGKNAYGVPIKIFSRPEVEDMFAIAKNYGFAPTGTVDLESQDKVVHWREYDLNFTFVNFALQKTESLDSSKA